MQKASKSLVGKFINTRLRLLTLDDSEQKARGSYIVSLNYGDKAQIVESKLILPILHMKFTIQWFFITQIDYYFTDYEYCL